MSHGARLVGVVAVIVTVVWMATAVAPEALLSIAVAAAALAACGYGLALPHIARYVELQRERLLQM